MTGDGSRWRAATRDDRRFALLWAAAAVALLAVSPLAPRIAPLLPTCSYREWLGIPCATCGTSGAALALARGDVPGALRSNPLGASAAIVFLAGGLIAPLWAWIVARVPTRRPRGRSLLAGIVLLILANWAYLVFIRG